MTIDQPSQKRCSKCRELKQLDAFHKNKRHKDGRHHYCKTCRAAYSATNAQYISEYGRAYRVENIERERKRSHAYYVAHIEARRVYSRSHYVANIETYREKHLIYRTANAEARRKQDRAYRAANPDRARATWHRRRARIKANGGDFSPAELRALRVAQAGICAYCERQYDPDFLSVDHVIPIDQKGRHEAANIVLACPCCNSSKNNRTPEQWTNRWYYRDSRLCTKRWPGRKHK